MIRLLIIADDFTGALDTGVQMASRGAATKVTADRNSPFSAYENIEVLVIDAETRHLPMEEAGDVVRHIVRRAVEQKIPYLYKKTDSALRGNIGAELAAMLEASGETQLAFLPAFPQIGRDTIDGVHYIGNQPVADSVFGADPFEPVKHSAISELIGEQSDVPVYSVKAAIENLNRGDGIYVFDADSQEALIQAGKMLVNAGKLHISAGSAGFGSVLPGLIGLEREPSERPKLDERLLVVCGSVNPITKEQMAEADKAGFTHWRLNPMQKLDSAYWQSEEGKATLLTLRRLLKESPAMIIDSNDEGDNSPTEQYAAERGLCVEDIRVGIAGALGHIMSELFTSPDLGTLLITGGDTLLQCMEQIGVTELEPVCELYPGVVLSRFLWHDRSRLVLSKSGGFGTKTLLTDLRTYLTKT